MGGVAVHREPMRRQQSNFNVAIRINSTGTSVAAEQLWARRIDDTTFALCCVSFFAYDLALADIVEVDSTYWISHVVVPSGRYVFRVYFGQSASTRTDVQDEITARLTNMGALLEWSSSSLLANDARNYAHARPVADFLQECDALGHLIYETGKST